MANRLGPDDLVVIAGGGISGLALAAALQSRAPERRPKVIVLERDPTFEARRQGARLLRRRFPSEADAKAEPLDQLACSQERGA